MQRVVESERYIRGGMQPTEYSGMTDANAAQLVSMPESFDDSMLIQCVRVEIQLTIATDREQRAIRQQLPHGPPYPRRSAVRRIRRNCALL